MAKIRISKNSLFMLQQTLEANAASKGERSDSSPQGDFALPCYTFHKPSGKALKRGMPSWGSHQFAFDSTLM
jgi:hypothetical protein